MNQYLYSFPFPSVVLFGFALTNRYSLNDCNLRYGKKGKKLSNNCHKGHKLLTMFTVPPSLPTCNAHSI